MNASTKATLAATLAITAATAGTIFGGVVPTLVFFVMLLLSGAGSVAYAAIALPGVGLLVWHPGLLSGAQHPPIRTTVLLIVVGVGQLPWFYYSWEYGVSHWGFWYCVALLSANLLSAGLIAVVLRRARHRPGFARNLLSHALLFAWIGTVAFPYLGELP